MDAEQVRNALLQKNYFPHHRTKSSEMPPCFSTNHLSAAVFKKVLATPPGTTATNDYDFVPYTLTRFNGGPRLCGIPHPFPYCRLINRIESDWPRIEPLLVSSSSQIQAKLHPDGRLFVMDYESQFSRSKTYLNRQARKRFVAKTDISHFYPSVYTHSLSWAAVGVEEAKLNRKVGSKWYNRLDASVRACKRNETNGLLIGPGTSSLMAEIILTEVDRRLENAGFEFLRFIDDYTCFTETREKATAFLRNLEVALSRYSLFLNFGKTSITDLTGSELPEWIPALQVDTLPAQPNFFSLKLYFSRAVALAAQHPDGSVLRYAIHALKDRTFTPQSGEYVLRTLFALSLRHPHLMGSIEDFLQFGYAPSGFSYMGEIESLIETAVSARRSDAICWSLYLAKRVGLTTSGGLAQAVLKSYDPCALILLYEVGDTPTRRAITNWTKKRILARDRTVQERNWILLHYLLNEKVLKAADVADRTLRLLKKEKINLFEF